MHTAALPPTTEPDQPDPSRTGALWVAGTGAFLLFAAAVVFVAVRWSDIPEGAKLAALGATTAALLVAGRTTRTAFPATATALFHLGAFLLPLDVAAAMMRAPVDTGWVLVATGLAGVGGLGVGSRRVRPPAGRRGRRAFPPNGMWTCGYDRPNTAQRPAGYCRRAGEGRRRW